MLTPSCLFPLTFLYTPGLSHLPMTWENALGTALRALMNVDRPPFPHRNGKCLSHRQRSKENLSTGKGTIKSFLTSVRKYYHRYIKVSWHCSRRRSWLMFKQSRKKNKIGALLARQDPNILFSFVDNGRRITSSLKKKNSTNPFIFEKNTHFSSPSYITTENSGELHPAFLPFSGLKFKLSFELSLLT